MNTTSLDSTFSLSSSNPSSVPPPASAPAELFAASLGKRAIGAVVDYLAFALVSALSLRLGTATAGPLLLALVQATLITLRGQSLGKLVARTRIVRTNGAPAGLVRGYLVRNLVPTAMLSAATIVAYIAALLLGASRDDLPILGVLVALGYAVFDLILLFDEDHRHIPDRLAGTRVIDLGTTLPLD